MNKKIPFTVAIGLILLLAIGVGWAILSQNPYIVNSGMVDFLLSPEEIVKKDAAREIKRLKSFFPDTLGNYVLYGRSAEKIQIRTECNNIEDHPDTKGAGVSGKACGKTVTGEYRDGNRHVVFVHLTKFTQGEELYRALTQKMARPGMLARENVFRLEEHEIGWFPANDFDVILTQEGMYTFNPDGSEMMSYPDKANGNNSVSQYFISKFPPSETP